jgi:hypothetical protein
MRIDDLSRHKDRQGPEILGSDRASGRQGSEGAFYDELFSSRPLLAVDRGASATVFKVSDPPTSENNEAAIKFLRDRGLPETPIHLKIASSQANRELPKDDLERLFQQAREAIEEAVKFAEENAQRRLRGDALSKFRSEAAAHLQLEPDGKMRVDDDFIDAQADALRGPSAEGPNLRLDIERYNRIMEIRGLRKIPIDDESPDPKFIAKEIREVVEANLGDMAADTTGYVRDLSKQLIEMLADTTTRGARGRKGPFGLRIVEANDVEANDPVIKTLNKDDGGPARRLAVSVAHQLEAWSTFYKENPNPAAFKERVTWVLQRHKLDINDVHARLKNVVDDAPLERIRRVVSEVVETPE